MKKSIYQASPVFPLAHRQWPEKSLKQAPLWCSIDLTAGNNGLSSPMTFEGKLALFNELVTIGMKDIEVATPANSEEEFQFVRHLIEHHCVPDDVTIGVVCQIKDSDIIRCFEAIKGASNARLCLYNSTSNWRRTAIYGVDEKAIIERVKTGLATAKQLSEDLADSVQLEYSAEGFNTTEAPLLEQLIGVVTELVDSGLTRPFIFNLNACVECEPANGFADRVEWVANRIKQDSNIILSVEVHNDRGTANAGAELAQLAGAARVRGSLFGHGERCGVASLVTLALNLYTQGIKPQLALDNLPDLLEQVEIATGTSVSARQPYAGQFAFSAFVGHQQFAINKAYQDYQERDNSYWQVPYLPMNPEHIGRGNDEIIRLTTQSGRTGIAHVMKKYHGYRMPEGMQHEFSHLVKAQAKAKGDELLADEVWTLFSDHYFNVDTKFELKSVFFEKSHDMLPSLVCRANLLFEGEECDIQGTGKGASDSLIDALHSVFDLDLNIIDYRQHSQGEGTNARAVSYVHLSNGLKQCWGVGVDDDATLATLRAILGALNRTFV